jgi:phenylacetic acid degradation operon negative regulatory protein
MAADWDAWLAASCGDFSPVPSKNHGSGSRPVLPDAAKRPGSMRSVLLTVMAELMAPGHGTPWNAALLYILEGMGFDEPSARQGIWRVARDGLIYRIPDGRHVRWGLTDTGRGASVSRADGLDSLYSRHETGGGYIILFVSVPHARKSTRKLFYNSLRDAGYGNPLPGIWVAANTPDASRVEYLLQELNLKDTAICFVGTPIAIGLSEAELIKKSWDFGESVSQFAQCVEAHETAAQEYDGDVLFPFLALANAWAETPFLTGKVPLRLLGELMDIELIARYAELYNRWRASALARWGEIAEQYGPSRSRARAI